MRYIELLDENKEPMCGSDHTWVFDQRLSNGTVLTRLREHTLRQAKAYQGNVWKYIKPLGYYAQIRQGVRLCNSNPVVHGPILLNNPIPTKGEVS